MDSRTFFGFPAEQWKLLEEKNRCSVNLDHIENMILVSMDNENSFLTEHFTKLENELKEELASIETRLKRPRSPNKTGI